MVTKPFSFDNKTLIAVLYPLFVLDIHGSHPYRSFDIDMGTMQGASLLKHQTILFDLIDHLKGEGINSLSYNRFEAIKNDTVIKFVSRHGVPAIQLELNTTYVSPSTGNVEVQRFSKLVQSLARFVNPSLDSP